MPTKKIPDGVVNLVDILDEDGVVPNLTPGRMMVIS